MIILTQWFMSLTYTTSLNHQEPEQITGSRSEKEWPRRGQFLRVLLNRAKLVTLLFMVIYLFQRTLVKEKKGTILQIQSKLLLLWKHVVQNCFLRPFSLMGPFLDI